MKPGFFKNEDLAALSPMHRLCFAGLWTMADKAGRLEDRPRRIKGELFAYENVDVEPLLADLAHAGFLFRYIVKQIPIIQIVNFTKHQRPHKDEPVSQLPPPECDSVDSTHNNVDSLSSAANIARELELRTENGDGERGLELRTGIKALSSAPADQSPVGKLIQHYHSGYLKKFKEKPDINGGKDGKILKALAQAHSVATVAERIDRLLESTDPFIVKSGRTIGVLKACWNKLGSGGGIKPAALPIEQPNTWTQVRAELKANLNRQNFQTWFADTRLVSNGGSRLVVSVPSAQAQSWIAQWYAGDVQKAAERIERGLSVEFVVRA